MFNVGGPELLVIFLVALVVLGPKKLPEAAKQLGKAVQEFRRVSTGFKSELRDALNEPVDSTPRHVETTSSEQPAPPTSPGTAPDLASAPPTPGDGAQGTG